MTGGPEREYGVRVTMASGEEVLLTTAADSAQDARAEVEGHRRLLYGEGDAAGRSLGRLCPDTVVTAVHEAKPMAEWDRS